MNIQNISSPGVYINELNAFPNSTTPAASAVPAFIGYTPQASYNGQSYTNVAQKISSFAEFKAIYGLPDPPAPAAPAKQYNPQYYFVQQTAQPTEGDYLVINGSYYSLLPDPSTIYYLYNSVRLFYENGGGAAYIVSVGSYGQPLNTPTALGAAIVNPNVQLSDFLNGLALLKTETEPSIYLCPDATLLSVADNGTLMQAMLLQAYELATPVCIFDVIGGDAPTPQSFMNDITTFRNNMGTLGLSYGIAYYPFIGTTLLQITDLDYTNLFGGDITQLAPLINPASSSDAGVTGILANIENPTLSTLTIAQNNDALLTASPTYNTMMQQVLAAANILPPSGGMAGVIATTDNQSGPWQAPANTSIVGVNSLPINLSDAQQAVLNVDAVSGKSINAIRSFTGQGILVWGARTLDGNSQDWRYLTVRRTVNWIKQNCESIAQSYVIAPNNANTWASVKTAISSFLTSVWQAGGLQGAKASDAFSVACGLGSTMTSEDILNGFMNVTAQVAVVSPAEFIVISVQLQMASSS